MEDFFTNAVVRTFLGLGVCFALATLITQRIPRIQKMGLPLAIVAGLLGCVARLIDPSCMDVDVLKTMVYHGLALVFITVGLQFPSKSAKNRDALSIGFAISTMGALQGFIGALCIMVLSIVIGSQLHPGLGLLVPLGFNQGPGQALTFGKAWEATGLESGADLGIIIAALGFLWSIIVGIPLVLYGKRKGWLKADLESYSPVEVEKKDDRATWLQVPELLVASIGWVALTYLAVYGILHYTTDLLDSKPKIVNLLWGLHFIIALFVAFAARALLGRRITEEKTRSHNQRFQVLNNLAVDTTTSAGLVAIQVAILNANLGLVLLLTSLGGLVSLVGAVLLFRKAFKTLPFHHLVLWFGACTGTFPVGLSLLRMIDPDLSSPAPSNFTKGAAIALLTSAPLLVILGYATGNYPESYPTTGWITVGLLFLYAIILIGAWRVLVWNKSDSDI